MNILISGGAKNGKSYYAQKLAKQMAENGADCGKIQTVPLYYIATMIPYDEEDHARIRRHIAERAGWGFETLECGKNLRRLLQNDDATTRQRSDAAVQYQDSTMTQETETKCDAEIETKCSADFGIDPRGVFLLDSVTALLSNEMFREDGTMDPSAPERVAEDCTAFARATGNTVFVSDYIYADADRYDAMTEDYRQGLAWVDRQLAKVCDRVVEVSAGVITDWK